MEKPAFELIRDGEHIKMFADGHVEGLSSEDGKTVIINRVPTILKAGYQRLNAGKLD